MKLYLPAAIAGLVIVATSWIQGVQSERWGTFPELEVYAKELPKVPMNIGDWKGKPGAAISPNERESAGIVGYLSRVYTNSKGESVSLFLMSGRVNDMFYHTPDRCYPASGFETGAVPVDVEVKAGDTTATFKTTTFRKEGTHGNERLQIYWSWSAGKQWETTSNPKWTFQGQRALYKLYVHLKQADSDLGKNTAGVDFIKAVVPTLETVLKPGSEAASTAVPAKKSA